MKRIIIALALTVFLLNACGEDPMPGPGAEPHIYYSDMEITSFSYADVPAEGGKVKPTVTYQYKKFTEYSSKNIKEEVMKDGAVLSFYSDSLIIDKESGEITVEVNATIDVRTFDVAVEAVMDNYDKPYIPTKANKAATVKQLGNKEEVISSETVQLPLALEPHLCAMPFNDGTSVLSEKDIIEETYTSNNADGKYDDAFLAQHKAYSHGVLKTEEHVPTTGATIKVGGGQLARVDTYRSGKLDTVILAEPAITTKTTYNFVGNSTGYYKYPHVYTEDPSQSPNSAFANGTWTIDAIGAETVDEIKHTLTATVEGLSTTLTLNQNPNFTVKAVRNNWFLHIQSIGVETQRDEWPDYEDYPVGSNPKWPKDENGLGLPLEDTKALHPDVNRYIVFKLPMVCDRIQPQWQYLSGAIDPIEDSTIYNRWRHRTIITATASVRLKDGTTKNIEHTSEWFNTNHLPTMYIPVVENAAEDFEWTFTISIFPEEVDMLISEFDVKNDTDLLSQTWELPKVKFWDRLLTFKEYDEAKRFSGMFNTSIGFYGVLGDIIDGVPQEGITIDFDD